MNVSTSVDGDTGLPIVSVNDRYIMTITSADSQFRGATYSQLTTSIQRGLIEAYRERQPRMLLRRGLLALSIAVGAVGIGFGLKQIQLRLDRDKRYIVSEVANEAADEPLSEDPSTSEAEAGVAAPANLDDSNELDSGSVDDDISSEEISPEVSKQKLKNDLIGKALAISRVGVWVGSAIGIASLFPYTRWITVIALNTLSGIAVELLIIVIITYLVLRIAESAVEHLFAAIAEGRFITSAASPRLAQRIQTFAGVIKGVTIVLITGVGSLVALATIGIDIAPILAGAGILGLAVSFGAQSLVKDIINGFFILLEDQYGVGDVVSIDGSAGFVERIDRKSVV